MKDFFQRSETLPRLLKKNNFILWILFLSTRLALAQDLKNCNTFLCDLTDCSHTAAVRVMLEGAAGAIQEQYGENGSVDRKGLDSYLKYISYLARCEQKTCKDFSIPLERSAGKGWKIKEKLKFTDLRGDCKPSYDFLFIQNSTDRDVFYTPDKKKFLMSQKLSCKKIQGYKSAPERNMVFSEDRFLVTDWLDPLPASRSWARVLSFVPDGVTLTYRYIDENTFRFEWSNGAFLDFNSEGQFKASNFLKPKTLEPNLCYTVFDSDGKHIYPHLELIDGQRYVQDIGFQDINGRSFQKK